MNLNRGSSAAYINIDGGSATSDTTSQRTHTILAERGFTVKTPEKKHAYLRGIKSGIKKLLNGFEGYTASGLEIQDEIDDGENIQDTCSVTVSGSFGDLPCAFTLQGMPVSTEQIDFTRKYLRVLLGAIGESSKVMMAPAYKNNILSDYTKIRVSFIFDEGSHEDPEFCQNSYTVDLYREKDGTWLSNDIPQENIGRAILQAGGTHNTQKNIPANTPEKLRDIPTGSVVKILAPDTGEFLAQPKMEREIATARYYGIGKKQDELLAIFVEDDGEIILMTPDCFDELDIEIVEEGSPNHGECIQIRGISCKKLGNKGCIYSSEGTKKIDIQNGELVLVSDGKIMYHPRRN